MVSATSVLATDGPMTSPNEASTPAAKKPVPTVVHVTFDGGTVDVRFEIDDVDAVGFARKPRTTDEDDRVSAAIQTLSHAETWMHLNDEAQCAFSESGIAANLFRAQEAEAPRSTTPPKKTIDVEQLFQCRAPDQLAAIELSLIEHFPRIKEIIVNVTLPDAHRAEIVTTPRAAVSLRRDGA